MLIIHHWDTDGIASAALTIKSLNLDDFINITPPIGEFKFDDIIYEAMEKTEKIYVLDLNLTQELETIKKDTIFIDHHIQCKIKNPRVKQINPILNGESSKKFPSASFVVSDYFSVWNFWSSLGVIGDIGKEAFKIPKILKLLNDNNISMNEALRIVQLIDSNYIKMDRKAVGDAVNILLNLSPNELLEYKPWINNLKCIESTINEIISKIEVKNDIAFVEYSSPYNVISKIARKIVWDMNYSGAIVLNKSFHGNSQLYFRISNSMVEKINIEKIIQDLKNKGYNAGGKKEVLGVIFEKGKDEDVLNIINSHIQH